MTVKSNNAEHKHTNRLIHEKSPYLLQHAHNPVDWYPCPGVQRRSKRQPVNRKRYFSPSAIRSPAGLRIAIYAESGVLYRPVTDNRSINESSVGK